MAAQQYITIKAEFNSILRRITLPAQTPPTWATLQTSVKTAHGIPQQFPVKAVDADSGVTVANDRDVSELFSSAQDAGRRSVKLIFSPADADDDTFIVVTDSQLPGTDSNAGGTGDRELPAQKEDNDSELDESDGQTEVVAKGIETLSLADGDDADAETGLSDSGKRDFEASGSLLSSTTSVSSQPSSHTDVASLPDYTAAIPAPATSPSPAAPQTFDEFLAEVNPLITTLISKLESHPEFIPQLVSRFSTTLSSNNWGIIVSGPDETVVTTPVNPATPSGSTNPPPPAVADRYVPPYVWYGVVCDHCGKRAWGGPRYKCVTCADYDLCPSCYTSRTHKHEFHKCLRPDDLWKGVVCDGCGRRSWVGDRFKCCGCADYDLCSVCHQKSPSIHPHHTFTKLSRASTSTPSAWSSTPALTQNVRTDTLTRLFEMGFTDTERNIELVNQYGADVGKIVLALVRG